MNKDTKRGIVIGTSEHTKDFLEPLLNSIMGTKYDILVVSNGGYVPPFLTDWWNGNCEIWHKDGQRQRLSLVVNSWNGWELAVLERGKERFEEFIHIHDTCLVKDISLFNKSFEISGHVVYTKSNFHYMGKFVTKELPNLPRVHDKVTAIMLETTWLNGFKYTEFQPDLPAHSLEWIMIHGQKRMVIQNKYMQKFKGTAWISKEQLAELTEQERKKLNESTSK